MCRVKYLAHWAVYASVGHLGLNELTAGMVAQVLPKTCFVGGNVAYTPTGFAGSV